MTVVESFNGNAQTVTGTTLCPSRTPRVTAVVTEETHRRVPSGSGPRGLLEEGGSARTRGAWPDLGIPGGGGGCLRHSPVLGWGCWRL